MQMTCNSFEVNHSLYQTSMKLCTVVQFGALNSFRYGDMAATWHFCDGFSVAVKCIYNYAHLRNTNSMLFLCLLSIKILINVLLSCFNLNYGVYLYHRGPRQAICDWWWEGYRSCTLSRSRSPLWFLKSAIQPLAAEKKQTKNKWWLQLL